MPEMPSNRWFLFKKLVIFQIKLTLDALRDLFLSPVSFVFALIDIFQNKSYQESYFHKLMVLGGKTDGWLNLFSQHNVSHQDFPIDQTSEVEEENQTDTRVNFNDLPVSNVQATNNADDLFEKIESIIREQQATGNVTMTAKEKISLYLEKLTQKSVVGTVQELPSNDINQAVKYSVSDASSAIKKEEK